MFCAQEGYTSEKQRVTVIESIGSTTSAPATQRSQTTASASGLRNPDVLNAVQQTSQKRSNAVAPVKIFAVPQTAKTGTTPKVPRGSLVDVLA